MPSPTSFLGFFLAVVFASSMGGFLWWMLHPPKPIPSAAAKVRVAVDAIKTILVPTTGTDYSERGIELACRLGKEQNAVIHLIYVVEIPLSLSLGTPLSGKEQTAQELLTRGKEIVETHRMVAESRIERARNAAEKIVDLAKKENIELIVMGVQPRPGGVESIIGTTTEMLLRKIPCEIIIDAKPT